MSLTPAQRDLSSTDLWHESLERSKRRRELSELARKHQSRQKSASIAVTAAMATTPIAPTLSAFKGKAAKRTSISAHNLQLEQKENGGKRVLLERGMRNSAVAQVQEELKIAVDGVFGPVTELAVERFQKREGLPVNGKVDVRTWLELFPDGMVVFDPSQETAQLATSVPQGGVPGLPGYAGGGATGLAAAGGPSSNLVPGDGTPESADDVRTAQLQAAQGGAPEGTEADGGILPDRDAPRKSRSRDRDRDRDHDSRSKRRRGTVEGVTLDRSRGNGSSASNGSSRRSGSGSGSGGSTRSGPVGGPINVAPGLGSKAEMIAAMIAAANKIDRAGYSYKWGGGHNPSFSGPYDCSGAVSAVLHAAGLINRPMVSGEFMRWGRPGPGAVTIYANAGHVYMSINGRFFGTTRANPGGGAGWFNGSRRAGFVVVHVPFESMKFKKSAKKQNVKRTSTSRAQTRAANDTREPASQSEARRDAQSGGATYSSDGTAASQQQPAAQQAPAEQAPAQQAPAEQPAAQQAAAPAPAEQAPAAPAAAAPAETAAPAAAPVEQAAPAPEAAPAAPAAPEAAAPAPEAAPAAPAAEAPAPEAAAPAAEAPAAPEAAAPAEAAAPEAAAPQAPAEPEAAAPAEAAGPAEAAPEAAPATEAAGEATDATSGATDEDEDSAEESGSTAAG